MKLFLFLPTMVAAMGCLLQTASAAVSFTNTPAAVSNTYSGFITLTIGGLTNTETVVVQKFLDANTNGVIDGRDLLVQQFTLRDGTNFVIGGVTNGNVPGDLNATTGAITATLNFQNGDFVQNLVGKYLYKLSSPVGHFLPITNKFSVTNFPFAQKFTGNVVSNNTIRTLSNAVVLLFGPPRPGHNNGGPGQPLAGTVANNAGAYTIMVPPGSYSLLAFASNYVTSVQNLPVLTLGSGQTITTNLTMTNATASISGKMVDAANNAIGLPGVFMPVDSTNGLVAVTFTDTNGNFTARVTAGEWGLGSEDAGLIVHGYMSSRDKSVTNSGATNVTLAVSKADALFYGSVKDNLGNPMVGFQVGASDTTSNLFEMSGYTDPNGNYFVGALGLGSNDPWQLGLSSDNNSANYIFSQPDFDQNGGTNLAVGQAVLQNFTGILATNHITGNVKDNNGAIIAGVGVFASLYLNGTYYDTYGDTDTNGNYSLNAANGVWNLGLNCNGGNNSLKQLGNYDCPENESATISDNNATNDFIVQLCGGVSISTSSPLPVGEVNTFYNQFIQASDCAGIYNWSQTSGTLPGNLTLNPGGSTYVLSGFPTNSGNFSFTVQVDDGGGNTTNHQFSVAISNALRITTGSLPDGTNGSNYSQQLQAAAGVPFGGASPYSWSFMGGPPPNLSLSTNGLLSGSLTASGTFNFTVRVTDSLGGTASQALLLNVITPNIPPLTVGTGGNQIIVLWPASAGTNFIIQTTTNLANGPWVTATNGVPVISFLFSNSQPAQFFRLR